MWGNQKKITSDSWKNIDSGVMKYDDAIPKLHALFGSGKSWKDYHRPALVNHPKMCNSMIPVKAKELCVLCCCHSSGSRYAEHGYVIIQIKSYVWICIYIIILYIHRTIELLYSILVSCWSFVPYWKNSGHARKLLDTFCFFGCLLYAPPSWAFEILSTLLHYHAPVWKIRSRKSLEKYTQINQIIHINLSFEGLRKYISLSLHLMWQGLMLQKAFPITGQHPVPTGCIKNYYEHRIRYQTTKQIHPGFKTCKEWDKLPWNDWNIT